MNKTLTIFILSLLAACNSHIGGSYNASSQILKSGDVAKLSVRPGVDFSTPESPAWQAAREYAVDLTQAPPVHPSVTLYSTPTPLAQPVFLSAASNGINLFLRLRWSDKTQNTRTDRQRFSDGAAVQFALQGGSSTSYMMGTPDQPVNIWYWKAGVVEAQDLAAGGFGSTTQLPLGSLKVDSAYTENDEWILVFSRLLKSGKHQVDFTRENVLIALALWQGENQQRDGSKRVSTGWIEIK